MDTYVDIGDVFEMKLEEQVRRKCSKVFSFGTGSKSLRILRRKWLC
jgi:hypothetical protein